MTLADTQNFILDLTWEKDRTYKLEVLDSPAGQTTGTLTLPFSYEEVEAWALGYGLIINTGAKPRPMASSELSQLTPEEFGTRLYHALFSDRIKESFEKARYHCETHKQKLRLVLRFETQSEQHVNAAQIPWEFLCFPDTNTFLCTDKNISLVRHLEHPHNPQRPPLPTPLQILAVIPNPQGDKRVSPFNSQGFKAVLNDKLASRNTKLHILERPTLDQLGDYLRDNECHVLHFTGHGGHDGENWGLCFEDERGGLDWVSQSRLVNVLTQTDSLRLVHLVSCDTARADQQKKFSPFCGLAHALTAAKLPAVVAMQFPLLEEDAHIYMEGFYDRIAKGIPLDAAVNAARSKLHSAREKSIAWATPVVFLRDKSAELFLMPKVRTVHINTALDLTDSECEAIREKGITMLPLHEYFENQNKTTKTRRLKDPRDWKVISDKLSGLLAILKAECPVHFEGKSFLSIWFALGHSFQQSTRFKLSILQYNQKEEEEQTWCPNPAAAPSEIESKWARPGDLKDIVVSINMITPTFESQVSSYLQDSSLSELPWLHLSIPDLGRRVIQDEDDANAICNGVIKKLRERALGRVHLFLDVPAAAAFFIALETSLVPSFHVYEFQKPGYILAFELT